LAGLALSEDLPFIAGLFFVLILTLECPFLLKFASGNGLLRASDGFTYEGSWAQGAMEGRGSATYPHGQIYNGLFSNGRREGRGTILFTNGAVYEGRFRDDDVDGQGTMKMPKIMTVPREGKKKLKARSSGSADGEITSQKDNTVGEENMVPEGGQEAPEGAEEEDLKPDFMIPLSFQSDMGQILKISGFHGGG
jgi:hypothetical protein